MYPPELVSRVAALYASGMTQGEVGAAVGLSQKVIFNVMRRHGIEPRPAAKRDQRGERNHSWKGSDAGYKALHLRVQAERGTPSRCGRCGSTDDPGIVYEWANLTGRYDDVFDYERMCRSCHRQYDAGRRG